MFRGLDGEIPDFPISSQSLIKENCHNSRTSDDIDMKLGPVPKLDKRTKTTFMFRGLKTNLNNLNKTILA